jgi:hypothetical protein
MEHFSAQFRFPGAVTIRRPLKPRVADLVRSGELWQLRQYSLQYRFIAAAIMGWAERAPHRVIYEDRTGWDDLADNIERRAGQQSRNSSIFEHMRYKTDGLVAKRSVRD